MKFPKFKLDAKWKKTLYGNLDLPLIELPEGQFPQPNLHPSLNLQVRLSVDGVVDFEGPDWKLEAAPIHFSISPPKHSFSANGLNLLRGEDGEIGIAFDNDLSRHFFFIGKALSYPRFSLGLKVPATII